MVDLHNHTTLCHHATGTVAEYLERARRLTGQREFGFSEHSPWMFLPDERRFAPTEEEFEEYVRWIQVARSAAPRGSGLKIRLGIEMDFMPEKRAEAQAMAERHAFDYHIGSCHNLGDFVIDDPDSKERWRDSNAREVYERYFESLVAMLEWGFIDVVAHIDLPKKFGFVPARGYDDLMEMMIPHLRNAEAVVEINTAGRDKDCAEFYPAPHWVKRYVAAGIPFTIGSDAHAPGEVGRYREDALTLLCEAGARELIGFERRRKVGYPL